MKRNEFLLPLFTVLLFAVLYFIFKSVLAYLAISAVIAIIGSPLVKAFQKLRIKSFQVGRGLASFFALLSFYLIFGGILRIILPLLADEAQVLSSFNKEDVVISTEGPVAKVEQLIFEYSGKEVSIKTYIEEKVNSLLNFTTFRTWLNAITSFTGGLLMAFFSISFISFFFMKDGRYFLQQMKSIVPSKYREEAHELLPEIKTKLTRYFVGICFELLAVFTCLSIGLYFMDIEYFIMIAVFASIFNVIPYLGPIIGIVFGLTVTGITYCTGTSDCLNEVLPLLGKTLLVFAIVQLLDNILFQPLIYGKSINAHPLEIFLVVIIFGNLGGPIAMIVAIPTWSVVKIIIQEVRKNSEFLKTVYKKSENKENNG